MRPKLPRTEKISKAQTHVTVLDNLPYRTLAEVIIKMLSIEFNAESLKHSYGIEGDVFTTDLYCNINMDTRALRHIELSQIRDIARGMRIGFMQACVLADQGRA